MEIFFQLCKAVSFGLLIGFLLGGYRMLHHPSYTDAQIQKTQQLLRNISDVFKYITFLVLLLGLIWCMYYLALGISDPAQSEYATNMAQLIVSILTIISIIFAFFEFVRRKN